MSEHVSKKEYTYLSEHFPIIRYNCGKVILPIPNVELISNAIEAHVTEHMPKEADSSRIDVTAKCIKDFSITSVLEKAIGCEVNASQPMEHLNPD